MEGGVGGAAAGMRREADEGRPAGTERADVDAEIRVDGTAADGARVVTRVRVVELFLSRGVEDPYLNIR